jgi:hypothetical protein
MPIILDDINPLNNYGITHATVDQLAGIYTRYYQSSLSGVKIYQFLATFHHHY